MKEEVKIYKKIYEDMGFVTIPLSRNSKVPSPGFPLENVYQGLNFNGDFKYENIGIVTGRSLLVVFDCDTEKSIELFENLKNYKETAKVITRRGKHYYYRVETDHTKLHPTKWKTPDEILKIDLKAGHSYIVGPPSTVENHKYVWEPEDWSYAPPITTLTEEEFQAIVKELDEVFGKDKDIEKKTKNIQKNSKIDTKKIIEILKNYYTEGNRQDIVLGLAGICKKAGIDKETVLDIAEILYKECNDTDSIRQRFSAVEQTYNKDADEVAGWSILEKILSEEDLYELQKLFRDREKDILADAEMIIETENIKFILNKNDWYALVETKKGVTPTKICPFLLVPKSYRIDNKVAYIIKTEDAELMLDELDYQKLEKNLGRPILNIKLAKILLDELIKQSKRVILYNKTGWLNQNIFLHPHIHYENIEVNLKNYQELFIQKDKTEQHNFIFSVLQEGKFLAAKIVFAVAGLFLKNNGFAIIDVAEKGIGKTLTSILATNIFYDSRTPHTCYGTKTAMELLLKTFSNMPVIFDEVALSFDEQIQSLIFMLSSGKGKARGTPSLAVNINDLNNVIFITSERDISFDRLGAFRRFISIKALKTEDYSSFDIKDLVKKINLVGCGTDYILFLLSNINYIREEGLFSDFQKFSFVNSIEKAIVLLEKFYNLKFEKTRNTIIQLLNEQYSEVEKSVYDIFWDRFLNFLIEKGNYFVKRKVTENGFETTPSKGDTLGYIDESNEKVYILSSVFKKFCKDENLPMKTILNIAREKKQLVTESENEYRVMKHIPIVNIKATTYCFSLYKPLLQKQK
mgnify:CR=1 FL=1